MKYFSTFSGIGGFELGIGNKGECIGFSEIDKYATEIYLKHFPEHKNYGDITKIATESIPDFDLLCGGFPCQSFSIAGKRQGFEDTRGTLFFDICRIVKKKRPKYLLLENVKGLLSHDNGRTFKTIITSLTELGYCVEWQVLNSKNFGVPQNRERVFIIGHLRGTPRPQVFPFQAADKGIDERNRGGLPGEIQAKRRTPDSRYAYGEVSQDGENGHIHQINNPVHSNNRVFGIEGISPTLNTMQGGNRQPKIVAVKTQRTEESKKIRKEMMAKGKDWCPRQGYELSARTDELMNTLTCNWEINQSVTDDLSIRRLTPLECERLQGFPDNWTEGISDSQRYKCLGNAVTVNVIKAIVERL